MYFIACLSEEKFVTFWAMIWGRGGGGVEGEDEAPK